MILDFHSSFKKAYKKRIAYNQKLVKKTAEQIEKFRTNPKDTALKDHALLGKKSKLRSFSVTGDYRIVYKLVSSNHAQLLDIGTHNQVY